jgi:hypothetical protein
LQALRSKKSPAFDSEPQLEHPSLISDKINLPIFRGYKSQLPSRIGQLQESINRYSFAAASLASKKQQSLDPNILLFNQIEFNCQSDILPGSE